MVFHAKCKRYLLAPCYTWLGLSRGYHFPAAAVATVSANSITRFYRFLALQTFNERNATLHRDKTRVVKDRDCQISAVFSRICSTQGFSLYNIYL